MNSSMMTSTDNDIPIFVSVWFSFSMSSRVSTAAVAASAQVWAFSAFSGPKTPHATFT